MSGGALVGIDGDDTLWHSEIHFELTQRRVHELIASWVDVEDFDARLLATERRNLELFGYGVKGFALSTIETVIELTEGRIPAAELGRIIDFAKEMLAHPIELLDGVADGLAQLGAEYRLVLVTKGDLFHQETKVAASGLADHFDSVEIVAEKDVATYRRILARYDVAPGRFVMVGNTLRSDVLPVVELGGRAVHVPYHITWDVEHGEIPDEVRDRVATADGFGQVPAAVAALVANGAVR
ncbi:MAG: HAD family hydrolase [Acidimicrobiia bacterium]|nr:HAD family hydrolase [Acidimicrobiia bacterium]